MKEKNWFLIKPQKDYVLPKRLFILILNDLDNVIIDYI